MTSRPFTVLVAALLTMTVGAACAKPGARPADDQIGSVRFSVPPDTRTKLADIPWCDDPQGHAVLYPCKWDKSERPAPDWHPDVPDVAIWVVPGTCQQWLGRVNTNDRTWTCFYAPPPAT